jgi:hypothetical protein
MDILCIRGDGDRPGEDIMEPLLSTVEAGLSRGRAELDEGALSDEQRLETILIDLRLGQLIEVDDSTLGRWRGKITSLSHQVQIDAAGNLSGSSTFTFRKPRQ